MEWPSRAPTVGHIASVARRNSRQAVRVGLFVAAARTHTMGCFRAKGQVQRMSKIELLSMVKTVGGAAFDQILDVAVMLQWYSTGKPHWATTSAAIILFSGLISSKVLYDSVMANYVLQWQEACCSTKREQARRAFAEIAGNKRLARMSDVNNWTKEWDPLLSAKKKKEAVEKLTARVVKQQDDGQGQGEEEGREEVDNLSRDDFVEWYMTNVSRNDHGLSTFRSVGWKVIGALLCLIISMVGLAPAFSAIMALRAGFRNEHNDKPERGPSPLTGVKYLGLCEVLTETLPQCALQMHVGISYGRFDPQNPDFSMTLLISVSVGIIVGAVAKQSADLQTRSEQLVTLDYNSSGCQQRPRRPVLVSHVYWQIGDAAGWPTLYGIVSFVCAVFLLSSHVFGIALTACAWGIWGFFFAATGLIILGLTTMESMSRSKPGPYRCKCHRRQCCRRTLAIGISLFLPMMFLCSIAAFFFVLPHSSNVLQTPLENYGNVLVDFADSAAENLVNEDNTTETGVSNGTCIIYNFSHTGVDQMLCDFTPEYWKNNSVLDMADDWDCLARANGLFPYMILAVSYFVWGSLCIILDPEYGPCSQQPGDPQLTIPLDDMPVAWRPRTWWCKCSTCMKTYCSCCAPPFEQVDDMALVMAEACKALQCESASIWLLVNTATGSSGSEKELVLLGKGPKHSDEKTDSGVKGSKIAIDAENIVSECCKSNHPVTSKSVLAVPIRDDDDKVAGVLQVFNKRHSDRFDDSDKKTAEIWVYNFSRPYVLQIQELEKRQKDLEEGQRQAQAQGLRVIKRIHALKHGEDTSYISKAAAAMGSRAGDTRSEELLPQNSASDKKLGALRGTADDPGRKKARDTANAMKSTTGDKRPGSRLDP